MIHVESVTRDRCLTPEEGAQYLAQLAEVQAEKDEILAQLRTDSPDFVNWEEVAEFRALVKSLRAARESRGLSREQAAAAAHVDIRWLTDLEEGRIATSPLNALQNYAAAVGQHLILALTGSPR